MEQLIIRAENDYKGLDDWIGKKEIRKILLVCDDSILFQKKFVTHLEKFCHESGIDIVQFRGFQPNPLYENVTDGIKVFRKNHCDGIIAVGGGSALDVAKCIKLYAGLEGDGEKGSFLITEGPCLGIPFLAMPTTAGTGSEATKYAVIYYEGKKQSITSNDIIPEAVLMDPDSLKTLPTYQKKATMMDALCHAIESFWSVNSTEESRGYSKEAIETIVRNMEGFLENDEGARYNMLFAANLAGKAINITQTTAGHAMCYKITSLFHVAHGHAAILCDRELYPWMVENVERCTDPRGKEYLAGILDKIGVALGEKDGKAGTEKLARIFNYLEFDVPRADENQFEELGSSVNLVRLKNHPIELNKEDIDQLYRRILKGTDK